MSNPIKDAPLLTDAEIINLSEQVNELVDKQHSLQAELDKIQTLISIVRLVSEIHLGVPLNIRTVKSGLCRNVHVTNVTPAEEQQVLNERYALYECSDRTLRVDVTLKAGKAPSKGICTTSMKITCPTEQWAKRVSFDFVATGRFPNINQLLCKFAQEDKKPELDMAHV